MLKNARNIAIVLLIAAAVWGLPGGGNFADVFLAIISTIFVAGIVWVLGRAYRDHRDSIALLGTQHRALLYGSVAAIVVATAALESRRLDGALILVWFAVVGGAVFGLYRVWLHHRAYGY
ncbi:MAG TPA: hypothetical protein VNT22_00575 [Baekduia sp.]|nr:hypothetical protein [Baekduia sp.]